MAAAGPFAASVLRDHERQRADRASCAAASAFHRAGSSAPQAGDLLSLAALREAQEALVHAHAEGLPAIGDRSRSTGWRVTWSSCRGTWP